MWLQLRPVGRVQLPYHQVSNLLNLHLVLHLQLFIQDEYTFSVAVDTAAVLSSRQQIDLVRQVSLLKPDIDKLKRISKRRLLKINSLRRKSKSIKNKNYDLNVRLINLLEKEKNDKENLLLLDCVKNNPVIEKYLTKQQGHNM